KAYMILFQLDEADLRAALVHPHVMIGSDGSALAPYGPLGEGKPHPRSYGTFPRVLGEYAREQRTLPLATAVHKMTGLPAARLGLRDRRVVQIPLGASTRPVGRLTLVGRGRALKRAALPPGFGRELGTAIEQVWQRQRRTLRTTVLTEITRLLGSSDSLDDVLSAFANG